MEKNTSLVLLPQKGTTSYTRSRKVKAQNEPSQNVINNILSYSKALKVGKRGDGGHVEYIAN